MMSSDDLKMLLVILGSGDLMLSFHDGRSVSVHGAKLKQAALGGALHELIDESREAWNTSRGRGIGRRSLPCMKVTIAPPLDSGYTDMCTVPGVLG